MFLFKTSKNKCGCRFEILNEALKYTRERRVYTFHRLYCLYVLLKKTGLDRLKKSF